MEKYVLVKKNVLSRSFTPMCNRERDVAPWLEHSLMVRWVVGSILHDGPIELWYVPICFVLVVSGCCLFCVVENQVGFCVCSFFVVLVSCCLLLFCFVCLCLVAEQGADWGQIYMGAPIGVLEMHLPVKLPPLLRCRPC